MVTADHAGFVLIPPDAKDGLDALLRYRCDVGVLDGNPYMFARMLSDTPMSTNTDLREIVNACPDLQKPHHITSISLRRYVATVSQVCSLITGLTLYRLNLLCPLRLFVFKSIEVPLKCHTDFTNCHF